MTVFCCFFFSCDDYWSDGPGRWPVRWFLPVCMRVLGPETRDSTEHGRRQQRGQSGGGTVCQTVQYVNLTIWLKIVEMFLTRNSSTIWACLAFYPVIPVALCCGQPNFATWICDHIPPNSEQPRLCPWQLMFFPCCCRFAGFRSSTGWTSISYCSQEHIQSLYEHRWVDMEL